MVYYGRNFNTLHLKFFFSINIMFIHFNKLYIHSSLKIGLINIFIDILPKTIWYQLYFILHATKQPNFLVNHMIFKINFQQIFPFET